MREFYSKGVESMLVRYFVFAKDKYSVRPLPARGSAAVATWEAIAEEAYEDGVL